MFKTLLVTTAALVQAQQVELLDSIEALNIEQADYFAMIEDFQITEEAPVLETTYTGTPYSSARLWSIIDWSVGLTIGIYMPLMRVARDSDCFAGWLSMLLQFMAMNDQFNVKYDQAWYLSLSTAFSSFFSIYSTTNMCIDQYGVKETRQWMEVFSDAEKITKDQKDGKDKTEDDDLAQADVTQASETREKNNEKSDGNKGDAVPIPVPVPVPGVEVIPGQSLAAIPSDLFGFPTLSGSNNNPSAIMIASQVANVWAQINNLWVYQDSKLYFYLRGYYMGSTISSSIVLYHWWTEGGISWLYSVKPWIRYQAMLPQEIFDIVYDDDSIIKEEVAKDGAEPKTKR